MNHHPGSPKLDTPQFIKIPCHVSPFIVARSDNQGQDKLSGFFLVFNRSRLPHLAGVKRLHECKCRARIHSYCKHESVHFLHGSPREHKLESPAADRFAFGDGSAAHEKASAASAGKEFGKLEKMYASFIGSGSLEYRCR
jgi:hypothetical protein